MQGRASRRGKQAPDAVKDEDGVEPPQPEKASTKSKKPASKPTLKTTLQQKHQPGQNLVTPSSFIASPPQLEAAPARRRHIRQDD